MAERYILLVEDNPDDEALTLRALRRSHVLNEIVVVRDGAEALDYLFATGAYGGRDTRAMPELVLLDMKLPKVDGLEVLRRMRADERTRDLPVVILTSSKENEEIAPGEDLGPAGYARKPLDISKLAEAMRSLPSSFLILNSPPPRRPPG